MPEEDYIDRGRAESDQERPEIGQQQQEAAPAVKGTDHSLRHP